ncbi:MAG: hypothetical protein WBM41_11480 [Arenicellales bacterium]
MQSELCKSNSHCMMPRWAARMRHIAFVVCMLSLSACVTNEACNCEDIASARNETVLSATAGSIANDSRLRGPRKIQTRDLTDSEHPHPLYPRILDNQGMDQIGRMRLMRTSSRSVNTPVRYGLLHAHTLYSDGSGTPQDAYTRAAALGLDFLAVTPHNHNRAEMGAKGERRDGVLIANDHNLMNADGEVTFTRSFNINGVSTTEILTSPSIVRAASNATSNEFVAIVGQEFSSISSGNHVNVLGWNEVLTVSNGDFDGLYNAFGTATPVLQLNHPNVHLDFFYRGGQSSTIGKMFNDYGFDDFNEDFSVLVNAADPLVVLVEILTGPAFAQTNHETFHYDHHERDYYFYLIQGFHISPSVGHDNHFATWGDATPARMGVFSEELSLEGLLAAMRANRTFATEDSDLRIDFMINDSAMGDVLTVQEGGVLQPRIVIADDSDGDSEYTVELIYGDVQPQSRSNLVKWVPADGLSESWTFIGPGELIFDTYIASGVPEFFYVRVTQGDGERAWTAPIWINHPRS